jgi:hypothetical protein
MKCPNCDYVFASSPCSECGGEVLEESRYCCWCGKPIKQEKAQVDFSERIPCGDGNCIGTVNEGGVCNVCGKPYIGEPA